MNTIEIVLLIIGFVSVSLSFFIGKKGSISYENVEMGTTSKELWSTKEEELVKERIQAILQEESEEIVEKTTDVLNRKSNEKIMEFDEFSGQVLEKIKHNHEDVVFMYSMLTEKQKDIKEDVIKGAVAQKPVEVKTTSVNVTGETVPTEKKVVAKKQSAALEEKVAEVPVSKANGTQEQIIQMHKNGKTVLEISKELNIGQGEVKLMIALYGGKA